MARSNREKRERYLRAQRRRKPPKPDGPKSRFKCATCGTEIVQDVNFIVGDIRAFNPDTGEVTQVGGQMMAQTRCPNCGRLADATNAVTVTRDGRSVFGFADTPAQLQALSDTIDELQQLDEHASFEEIVGLLEQNDATRPVAEYIRKNHLTLAALGVGLLSAVIALLTWLLPVQNDEPAPAPDGITEDQMDRLIRDFESELADVRESEQQGHHGHGHGDHGEPEPRRADGGDTDGGAERP